MPEVTEEHIKRFAAVPTARVTEFLEQQGWQLLPGERSKSLWTVQGNDWDSLCAVCDGEPDIFDSGPVIEGPYCPKHHVPVAALVYPSPEPEGTEAALRTVCAQAHMTPTELFRALSLELVDEAHLHFHTSPFSFPADAEEVHDAVGSLMDIMRLCYATDEDDEAVVHGDVTLTAPNHVTMSFHHVLTSEPADEDDQIRARSREAAKRLERTLDFMHPGPRQLSVVRQYATGELVLDEVMGPEDFKPEGGPERELWDALDNLRHRHGAFARWRFDWSWSSP